MQMASGGKIELIGQYTVPVSWENDTLGNGKNIIDNVILPIIQDLAVGTTIYVETQGNTASQYAMVNGLLYKDVNISSSNATVILRKSGNSYSVRQFYGTSVSAWCSAGTIIKVYKINLEE